MSPPGGMLSVGALEGADADPGSMEKEGGKN